VHGGVDEPALAADGVSVAYGGRPALEDVSFALQPGELVALVGPNGAGKTSLFKAALGLVPHRGEIIVHGRKRHALAYVPQRLDVELDFPITTGQVVADGRRPYRRAWRGLGTADRQAVARALSRVGLDGLERRAVGELSGGQLQRALVARALAQEADVLLLDEPLAGVDASACEALVDLFEQLAAAGTALLVSTHDLALVRRRFARCIAVNRRLVGDGAPDDVLAPEELEHFFLPAHA
jgi:ABC-type Mn2+/Zn2+ transport system ATPase subunit